MWNRNNSVPACYGFRVWVVGMKPEQKQNVNFAHISWDILMFYEYVIIYCCEWHLLEWIESVYELYSRFRELLDWRDRRMPFQKGLVMLSIVFFAISLENLLNKQWHGQWSGAPQSLCDVTIMLGKCYLCMKSCIYHVIYMINHSWKVCEWYMLLE